jgi:lysyl-tRNA synthetase, class II
MKILTDRTSERFRKVQDLRAAGVDPYPAAAFKRTHTIGDVIVLQKQLVQDTSSVKLAGRVVGIRRMGNSVFADLLDGGERLQLMLRRNLLDDIRWLIVKLIDIGDHVGVSGMMVYTKTGELTVSVCGLELLSKAAEAMPIGKVDKTGEIHASLSDRGDRLRQRHVILNAEPRFRETVIKRARVLSEIRRYFNRKGFIELDTPILGGAYGGAAARPFTTQVNALDANMYLRISLEPALKRAVCGGLDKVFEIGHNFRNEGLDSTHSPEFTMMEWYESYSDYLDQMKRFEELIPLIAETVNQSTTISFRGRSVNLATPWQRVSILDALRDEIKVDLLGVCIDDMPRIFEEFHPRGEDRLPLNAVWGDAVMELFQALIEPRLWEPTFVMDYPADMSPLTKRHRDQPLLVERFEPMIGGIEIGNSYSELNDPWEQFERLSQQNREREEAYDYDIDFMTAIAHGLPQCGGSGLGIDRLVMLLTKTESIRDVHLFPMVSIGADLASGETA